MIKLLDLGISIILGMVLNYFVTSEIIAYMFQGLPSVYTPVLIVAIVIQILFVFVAIQLIRSKNIDKKTCNALWVLYYVIMVMLLFGRRQAGSSINLNVLDLFQKESLIYNMMNTIFFVPVGYCFYSKKVKTKNMILLAFAGIILIELMQLILHVGIFDVCDIILNTLGISIGYFISKRYFK